MPKKTFNRASRDVGNIIALEHVNVTVPDQALATFFYVNVMGLTRDPYMDFGPFNVWVNAGKQQFHLPTSKAQVLRGHTGLVVPDLAKLEARLGAMARRLKDSSFSYTIKKQVIDVTCPWGNLLRCYGPGQFGDMQLGMPYVELNVPTGTARGIKAFYETVMGCQTQINKKANQLSVSVGQMQTIRFRETSKTLPEYDGHHIAIYVSDFSGPHSKLQAAGLITEESDRDQYRFQTLTDPNTGEALFDLEHEVRSLHHPMYGRPLVNRNASQSFFDYQSGRDAFTPEDVADK